MKRKRLRTEVENEIYYSQELPRIDEKHVSQILRS